jgi:hypothetical protein
MKAVTGEALLEVVAVKGEASREVEVAAATAV